MIEKNSWKANQPRDYLTLAELKRLLEVVDNRESKFSFRNRLIIEIMFWGGLRVSEVTKLDVDNVRTDLEPIRIELRNTKGGKNRDVPLSSEVVSRLRLYISQTRGLRKSYSRENPVFISLQGKRLTTRRIEQLVKDYGLKSGIEKHIHPHVFRHSFAVYCDKKGVDLMTIQQLLGHRHINTTQIYLNHLKSFDEKHKAYQKLMEVQE